MKTFSTLSLRCWANISLAAFIALLSATAATGQTLAALDTGDNPRCAKDGACNLAVCSADADPDCHDLDLPPGAGADPVTPATTISLETDECSSTQDVDILAVAWNIVDDWTNFERTVEAATGTSLGNCTRDRLKVNGKVECLAKYDCKTKNGQQACKLGQASGLSKKIKIYQSFFDNVAGLTQPDRRACYAGLMAHEFAHTCERYAERIPEARAVAAVNYWKERFSPESSLDPEDDCGFND
jgi:hypothetical protein